MHKLCIEGYTGIYTISLLKHCHPHYHHHHHDHPSLPNQSVAHCMDCEDLTKDFWYCDFATCFVDQLIYLFTIYDQFLIASILVAYIFICFHMSESVKAMVDLVLYICNLFCSMINCIVYLLSTLFDPSNLSIHLCSVYQLAWWVSNANR